MRPARILLPRAREDGLVETTTGDELLVYDLECHKAHCLNRAAAFVWRNCDGKTTVDELVGRLEAEYERAFNREVVLLALQELRVCKLLTEKDGVRSQFKPRISRRELIRALGLSAGLLPFVASIVVPEAVAAQSSVCNGFTTQQTCETPLKMCGASGTQLFCRFRLVGTANKCICTNSL